MKSCLGLLCLLIITHAATAEVFQNSYITFNLTADWNCIPDLTEWACTPIDPIEQRETIIVLAAKEVGPTDSLLNYKQYLSQSRPLTDANGTMTTSQVSYARERELGGQTWVESLHYESEIPGFHTLYLATVKESLAILVSFSVQANLASKYNPIFNSIMRSLRITATEELLFNPHAAPPEGEINSGIIGVHISEHSNLAETSDSQNDLKLIYILIGGLLLLSLGFYLFERKKGA